MLENKNRKIRLVVDANVWISSLMSPGFQIRLEIVFGAEFHLLASDELFEELDETAQKPKVAKKITRSDYEKLVSRLLSIAELIDVHSVIDTCRDPEDDYLLALAKDGNADYLITGDLDLQVMKTFGKTKIVSLADFEKRQKPE